MNLLWYRTPAIQWFEALPVGDGRLGAMVFGQPRQKRLQLNDITVWSGGPQPNANRPEEHLHLPDIRRSIRAGRFEEAEQMCNEHFSCRAKYDENKYQTLGDLKFDFRLPDGEPSDYRRWLNIEKALAGVEFELGGTEYSREIYCSAPVKVLVQRITASKPGCIAFTMRLSRVERATTRVLNPSTLVMTGDTGPNLRYEACVTDLTKGGTVRGQGDSLEVAGADEAVVLLAANTS